MRLRQSDLPRQDLNGGDHNRASSSVVLDSSRWERGERPTRSHETSLSGAPTHLQKNSTGVALSPDHACTTAPQLLPVDRTRHRSPVPEPTARENRTSPSPPPSAPARQWLPRRLTAPDPRSRRTPTRARPFPFSSPRPRPPCRPRSPQPLRLPPSRPALERGNRRARPRHVGACPSPALACVCRASL